QMRAQALLVHANVDRFEAIDHATLFHEVVTLGERRREAEVLLDEKQRQAALAELADGALDLLDDYWGQTFSRFVEQNQLRAGPQDSRDCKHLLFPAREACA